jgi:hypothetical protein
MRKLVVVALASLASLPACSSSDSGTAGGAAAETGAGASPCSPFSPSSKPLSLGTLVAAGRGTGGVVYAVDETPTHDSHVFVSSEGGLFRQRVAGSGTSPDLDVFSIDDHVPPFTLQIDFASGAPVAMGVLEGPLPAGSKSFVIGKDGETLTLLALADVAGLPVHNLPGAQVLEYDARLADGREMVVIRPQDDWTYGDFRVFVGTPPTLAERHVTNVSRGNDTYIDFDLGGVPAQAIFRWAFSPDGGSGPGEATLAMAGATQTLTQLPTTAPPQGITYTCFAR